MLTRAVTINQSSIANVFKIKTRTLAREATEIHPRKMNTVVTATRLGPPLSFTMSTLQSNAREEESKVEEVSNHYSPLITTKTII